MDDIDQDSGTKVGDPWHPGAPIQPNHGKHINRNRLWGNKHVEQAWALVCFRLVRHVLYMIISRIDDEESLLLAFGDGSHCGD